MGRIKQLTDMEIDEISLVDRPANAHAKVVISKRAGEEDMPEEIYDEDGDLLDEVEVGDIVFDADGDPFLVVDGDYEDFADAYDYEEVGKKIAVNPSGVASKVTGSELEVARGKELATIPKASNEVAIPGKAKGKGNNKSHWDKYKWGYAGLGGASVAGAGGYAAMKKSFSDELREELSKSLSDIERDEVISKAFSQVEAMAESLAEAEEIAKSERDLRLLAEYEEVAKSYNVPVDPAELAPVLYTIAEVLPYEYGEVIHKALSAAGSMIFEEVGFEGAAANNDVLYAVDQFIEENVSKSEISKAEAVSAVFDANPDAYDQYMATRYL